MITKQPDKPKFTNKPVCYHCEFYNHGGSQCRRFPAYVKHGEADWCGEWKQRSFGKAIGVES